MFEEEREREREMDGKCDKYYWNLLRKVLHRINQCPKWIMPALQESYTNCRTLQSKLYHWSILTGFPSSKKRKSKHAIAEHGRKLLLLELGSLLICIHVIMLHLRVKVIYWPQFMAGNSVFMDEWEQMFSWKIISAGNHFFSTNNFHWSVGDIKFIYTDCWSIGNQLTGHQNCLSHTNNRSLSQPVIALSQ